MFNNPIGENELKTMIEIWIESTEHIESLINTIIIKTSERSDIDIEKLKILLLELERIRLELEYKE
jgi:hypothetical protein